MDAVVLQKRCIKCKELKLIGGFYKNAGMKDGHLNKCRVCCLDEAMTRHTNKMITQNNSRFTDRQKANIVVGNALRDGLLVRTPCERCGNLRVMAYHNDYSKPLEVRWLCENHHPVTQGETR